ncbi:RcnB family protein [Mesorhizobium sp. VK23B]|uniref:RcnB family protein n=1 Tax=Mesorhizobium dulcispinae TaxID=3072316 RepID=A0ABU4XLX7_9HYPH|nr:MULTISPECIES: RcnB family protein [unclassified Mesorhizobium]MDX8469405.1 RcnB family protein [Mesorhizobium sp. VK23B]MDX8475744.1 RcnB family protein [Mesorhizobium sp. VK23A]
MKRLILSAVTASMLAASAFSGQAAPLVQPSAPQSNLTQVDWQRPGRHVEKRVVKKKVVVKRSHWRNGQKYSNWKRHQAVRDGNRYGLRRPGPGQEWIRVGNDYLLVSIVSGIIFGAIAAHRSGNDPNTGRAAERPPSFCL